MSKENIPNVRIRPYVKEDFPAVIALFNKQQFVYEFPTEDEFVDIQLVVNEEDEIQMVLASRKIIEYYLLVNPDREINAWTTFAYIKLLIAESWKKLAKAGYKQVFAFLPPEIAKNFGRRLIKLGGKCYTWPVIGGKIL